MQLNLSILAAFMALATCTIAAPGHNKDVAAPFHEAAMDLFEVRSVDGVDAICKNGGHNCGSVCCPKGIPCLGTHSCRLSSENLEEVAREERSVDVAGRKCKKGQEQCGNACCSHGRTCVRGGCHPPDELDQAAAREVRSIATTKKQCNAGNGLWCGKICCAQGLLCYGPSGCRSPPPRA